MRSSRLPIVLLCSASVLGGGAALADDPPAGAPAPAAPAAAAPAAPASPEAPAPAPRKPGYQSPVPPAKQAIARSGRGRKAGPTWNGPVASYPGFRMLEGGGTRVFLGVDRKVDVTEHKAPGRIIYRMAGTMAPANTNRLPILSSYFPSVVHRVQLVQQGNDLDLVVDVREGVGAERRVLDGEKGIVVQIDFPKSSSYDAWKAAKESAVPATADPTGPRARRTTDTTRIEGQGTDRAQSPY